MSKKTKVIQLFLSHSAADSDLADALIQLLLSATTIDGDIIRCTSLVPFALRIGDNPEEELRREAVSCKVFLALLTPVSIRSTYVMCEIGARWGSGEKFWPLIARGVPSWALRQPLASPNRIDIRDPTSLNSLITQVVDSFGCDRRAPERYQSYLQGVLSLANQAPQGSVDNAWQTARAAIGTISAQVDFLVTELQQTRQLETLQEELVPKNE